MKKSTVTASGRAVPLTHVNTLIVGSGAAGLCAATQLRQGGLEDLLILTEGLRMGTSINTGSDKQTYYKLSMCGVDADAPRLMAENYFEGGSMHGDLALVEASVSARAFLNLVGLGVPFPQDPYGQFVGYKTDHDPRQRATSIGPYTSRDMCRALIRKVEAQQTPVRERVNVVELLVIETGEEKRCCGVVAVDEEGVPEAFLAENVIFATGGPGGLYQTSVYPNVHTGAIGVGLLAGAKAQSLPESQYGLASIKFRWNVSGTYMQVIPRFISTAADGESDPQEFLRPYFSSVGEMNSMVFLKGYQWPFDSRKVDGGSSLVDIFVYIETVCKGRRVYLDFRENPADFRFEDLSAEAREYLENSRALQETPVARLEKMNPGAITLYLDHEIDIKTEMLEVAVCAQHNNGGLAANHWWESLNIKHLFPVGEVNGSHGVYRPGGSALNAGQVGAIRAADYILARYRDENLHRSSAEAVARTAVAGVLEYLERCSSTARSWSEEREELQRRMSKAGAHIRSKEGIKDALRDARAQWTRLETEGSRVENGRARVEALRNRQLCFAHLVYLEALKTAMESGVGSRGSALVLSASGQQPHPSLGREWHYLPEDSSFREQVLETVVEQGEIRSAWVARRVIPESDTWFETAWAAFRNGEIYR